MSEAFFKIPCKVEELRVYWLAVYALSKFVLFFWNFLAKGIGVILLWFCCCLLVDRYFKRFQCSIC